MIPEPSLEDLDFTYEAVFKLSHKVRVYVVLLADEHFLDHLVNFHTTYELRGL